MIDNLKVCLPVMYHVFTSFKKQQASGPAIMHKDIQIASGECVLDPGQTKVYFKNLESILENLHLAFEKQVGNMAVCLCI